MHALRPKYGVPLLVAPTKEDNCRTYHQKKARSITYYHYIACTTIFRAAIASEKQDKVVSYPRSNCDRYLGIEGYNK